jgi:hypothetical protein
MGRNFLEVPLANWYGVEGPSRRMTMELHGDELAFFKAAEKEGIGTPRGGYDWHEPDCYDVSAHVVGRTFDNAGVDGEKQVILTVNRKPVAAINLATLCALAHAMVRRTQSEEKL